MNEQFFAVGDVVVNTYGKFAIVEAIENGTYLGHQVNDDGEIKEPMVYLNPRYWSIEGKTECDTCEDNSGECPECEGNPDDGCELCDGTGVCFQCNGTGEIQISAGLVEPATA